MQIRPHLRTPETDELLRRVGRNVVNLQYVEHLLKRLTVLSMPVGPASKMAAQVEQHVAVVNTSTMGTLAGKLMHAVLQLPVEKSATDDIDEIWMSFRFSIDVNAEFIDHHDREMRALVDARNELIHNFLPRWHSSASGDTTSAIEYLDAQHTEVMRMMDRLQEWVTTAEESCKKFAEFLASPETDQQFELAYLRGSRLVALLGEIAKRTARADGWAFFTTAANLIRREAPDELEDLRNRYSLPTLKAVLLATGFFDVANEELPKGGVRTIYRINDRYELDLQEEINP